MAESRPYAAGLVCGASTFEAQCVIHNAMSALTTARSRWLRVAASQTCTLLRVCSASSLRESLNAFGVFELRCSARGPCTETQRHM